MIPGLLRRNPGHGEIVDIDGLSVRLRVNPRARRVSLKVDGVAREAIAVAPSARRLKDAVAFAREKRGWLAERLDRVPAAQPFAPEAVVPFRGQPLVLRHSGGAGAARLSADGTRLIAGGDPAGFSRRVEALLKREARRHLTDRTRVHARALGVAEPTVSLGDPTSRWGSCSHRGAIRYSWRLILSPPSVLDYVAAHEVAHLIEANHGPRFWAVVRRLYGDPTAARRWLKAHGPALHAVGQPTRSGSLPISSP